MGKRKHWKKRIERKTKDPKIVRRIYDKEIDIRDKEHKCKKKKVNMKVNKYLYKYQKGKTLILNEDEYKAFEKYQNELKYVANAKLAKSIDELKEETKNKK